jgi:hypothetical protein
MEQVIANIYAACLSAEPEPNAELVDLTISAIQDGIAGPNKDEALSAIFTAVEELSTERRQKGALFRIKLASIAAAAKTLPKNIVDTLLNSLKALAEVAQLHSLSATTDTINVIRNTIEKKESTAVGQPAPSPDPRKTQSTPGVPKMPSKGRLTLQEYLKQSGKIVSSDRIYVAPDIPLKKISGALHSTSGAITAEEIIVLIDDTVFGGAKEGVYITNDRIFVKAIMASLATYRLDGMQHIGADGRKIFINQREIVGLNQPDKRDLGILFSAINEYLTLARTQPTSTQAPSHGTSQITSEEEDEEEEEVEGEEEEVEDEEEEELDSEHGFFYSKAAELYFISDDKHRDRMLLIDLVNTAMGLNQFLLRQGLSVSEDAQWIATSDVVHFESLLYVTELTLFLLETNLSLKKETMDAFTQFVYQSLYFPYVGLFTNEAVIEEQLKIRVGLYRLMLRNNPNELPKLLLSFLTHPSARLAYDDERQEVIESAILQLQSEGLTEEITEVYIREISEGVRSSLMRYSDSLAGC